VRTAHGAVLMVLVAVRAAILGAAIAGAAVKYGPSGPDGRRLLPLDLVAGWSLLAAAWARHVTGGCRALLGPTEVIWFLATPQVVGGGAGHAAALLGGAWLAPSRTGYEERHSRVRLCHRHRRELRTTAVRPAAPADLRQQPWRSFTAFSQTEQTAPDRGGHSGFPADPDLRVRSEDRFQMPHYWQHGCPAVASGLHVDPRSQPTVCKVDICVRR